MLPSLPPSKALAGQGVALENAVFEDLSVVKAKAGDPEATFTLKSALPIFTKASSRLAAGLTA